MAGKEPIGFQVEVQTDEAVTSMGSFRKQLREANQELLEMTTKFGDMSDEAVAAAKKVAGLKDSIADAKSLTDAFNPDQKFAAFSQSLSGVVGGFAAVQGAMGLFGVESKEIEQQLLKVQAAMALSQGLNTVMDSIQSFKNLGAVIRANTIYQTANAAATNLANAAMRLFGISTVGTAGAFNVLKVAIAATGIGLLLIALGTAISLLQDYASKAERAAEAQKKLNEATLEYAKAGRDAELAFIENTKKVEIARAEEAGKSAAEIAAIEESYSKRKIDSLKRYDAEAGHLDAQSKQALQGAEADHQVTLSKTRQKAREEDEKKSKEAAAKSKAAAEKATAERKQALQEALQAEQQTTEEFNKLKLSEEEQSQYDLTLKYAERIKALERVGQDTSKLIEAYELQSAAIYDKYRIEEQKKREDDHQEKLRKQQELADSEKDTISKGFEAKMFWLDQEKADFVTRLDAINNFNQQVLENELLTQEQRTEFERQFAAARTKIAQEEQEQKKRALQQGANALDQFAELAGEQTAAGKTLAIASTIISTYLAAQESFAAMASIPYVGPDLGAIAAAAAIASGIARVKKITEIKIPGVAGGGGAAASFSAPAIGSTTIGSAPVTPSTAAGGSGMNEMLGEMKQTQNKTNESLDNLNNTLKGGIKANILEGEVAGQMGRSRAITNGAELGE